MSVKRKVINLAWWFAETMDAVMRPKVRPDWLRQFLLEIGVLTYRSPIRRPSL